MDSLPYVDTLFKEYLLFRGFTNTLQSFSSELDTDRCCGFQPEALCELIFGQLLPQCRTTQLLQLLELLADRLYSQLDGRFEPVVERMEVALIKAALVTCVRAGRQDKVGEFFRQHGDTLLSGTEAGVWRQWAALAFVPTPRKDPAFQAYFNPEWLSLLEVSFRNFLSQVIAALPLPAVLRFNADRRQRLALQQQVDALQRQLHSVSQQLAAAATQSQAAGASQCPPSPPSPPPPSPPPPPRLPPLHQQASGATSPAASATVAADTNTTLLNRAASVSISAATSTKAKKLNSTTLASAATSQGMGPLAAAAAVAPLLTDAAAVAAVTSDMAAPPSTTTTKSGGGGANINDRDGGGVYEPSESRSGGRGGGGGGGRGGIESASARPSPPPTDRPPGADGMNSGGADSGGRFATEGGDSGSGGVGVAPRDESVSSASGQLPPPPPPPSVRGAKAETAVGQSSPPPSPPPSPSPPHQALQHHLMGLMAQSSESARPIRVQPPHHHHGRTLSLEAWHCPPGAEGYLQVPPSLAPPSPALDKTRQHPDGGGSPGPRSYGTGSGGGSSGGSFEGFASSGDPAAVTATAATVSGGTTAVVLLSVPLGGSVLGPAVAAAAAVEEEEECEDDPAVMLVAGPTEGQTHHDREAAGGDSEEEGEGEDEEGAGGGRGSSGSGSSGGGDEGGSSAGSSGGAESGGAGALPGAGASRMSASVGASTMSGGGLPKTYTQIHTRGHQSRPRSMSVGGIGGGSGSSGGGGGSAVVHPGVVGAGRWQAMSVTTTMPGTTLHGRGAAVLVAQFSPGGGANVATGAADGSVAIWLPTLGDAGGGGGAGGLAGAVHSPLASSRSRDARLSCGSPVTCVAWDARADKVMLVGTASRGILAWHADTRRVSAEIPPDPTVPWVTQLACSRKDPVFIVAAATGSPRGSRTAAVAAAAMAAATTPVRHPAGGGGSVSVGGSNASLSGISGGASSGSSIIGRLSVWNMRAFKRVSTFTVPQDTPVVSLAYNSQSSWFAAGTTCGAVHLYDSSSSGGRPQPLCTFRANTPLSPSAFASPSSPPAPPPPVVSTPAAVHVYDNGSETTLVTCCGATVRLWSLRRLSEPLLSVPLLPYLSYGGGAATAAASGGGVSWSPDWAPQLSLSPRGEAAAVVLGGGGPAVHVVDLQVRPGGAADESGGGNGSWRTTAVLGSPPPLYSGPAMHSPLPLQHDLMAASTASRISVILPYFGGGIDGGTFSEATPDPTLSYEYGMYEHGAGGEEVYGTSCSWHPTRDVLAVGYRDGGVALVGLGRGA